MNEARLLYGSTWPGQPLFSPDLLWKTQFKSVGPFFLCEFGNGESVIIIRGYEYERAKKEVKTCQVECADDFLTLLQVDETSAAIRFLKKYLFAKVVIPHGMPAGVFKRLLDSGLEVAVQDAQEPWYQARMIKTREEVGFIVEVQEKTEEVLHAVMQKLQKSFISSDRTIIDENGETLTAESLRNFMEMELARQGCLAINTIIACGDQAVDPHCEGTGPLLANLPIVIDVFPRSKENWYWSDMSRTFFKGKPKQAVKRMYKAVLEAQKLSIDMIRAGVNSLSVYEAVLQFFSKKGYNTNLEKGALEGFIHGLGHGVGIDIHEPPYYQILPEGCVVAIEPGLYYSGVGGVRIEDIVLVEKNGAKCLTSFPKELDDMIIP